MNYRPLGKQGVRLSEIGLGSWLTYGDSTAEETALACVRRAWEKGVNFFDTADVYAHGAAETLLGKALRGFRRADYVLATKCYFPMSGLPNDQGLSRKHIHESIDASLRRLGVDYVDLYQCHRYDEDTPLEETVRAMNDLIHRGKTLYWGVSQWTAVQIADACALAQRLNLIGPASDQPYYNLARQNIETDGVMEIAAREGLGLVAYSPLAQGILTGKYKPGAPPPAGSRATTDEGAEFMSRLLENRGLLERVQRLQPIADGLGCTMAQLALAWALRRPEITSVIIGATRPEQVDDNVRAAEIRLDEGTLGRIEEAMRERPND